MTITCSLLKSYLYIPTHLLRSRHLDKEVKNVSTYCVGDRMGGVGWGEKFLRPKMWTTRNSRFFSATPFGRKHFCRLTCGIHIQVQRDLLTEWLGHFSVDKHYVYKMTVGQKSVGQKSAVLMTVGLIYVDQMFVVQMSVV